MNEKNKPNIKILKNGPYVVTGNVKLSEKIIVSNGHGSEFREGRELPQGEKYLLCRCGKSKNPPFCDGSHTKHHFDGAETASRLKYEDRAELMQGPSIDLLDDDRCAFARFCHAEKGSTWELTANSYNEENKNEAIKTANNCPAGRLTAVEKSGEIIEPVLEPEIQILQDPYQGASAGIYVKGNIPLQSSDGQSYETRNRYTLCRCGESSNKPFCDAKHILVHYNDDGE